MKEQIKTPEKDLNKMESKQSVRCRAQNTVYKDAQVTYETSAAYKISSQK